MKIYLKQFKNFLWGERSVDEKVSDKNRKFNTLSCKFVLHKDFSSFTRVCYQKMAKTFHGIDLNSWRFPKFSVKNWITNNLILTGILKGSRLWRFVFLWWKLHLVYAARPNHAAWTQIQGRSTTQYAGQRQSTFVLSAFVLACLWNDCN